jgi:hypothetical protein
MKKIRKKYTDIPPNEVSVYVVIPFKSGHYQFTFKTGKDVEGAKWIRRIYQSKDMNAALKIAMEHALSEYPESWGHVIHSPQTND